MIYVCLLLVLVYTTIEHYHNPYLNHNINYLTNRLSIILALYIIIHYFLFKDLIHLLYIDRDNTNIIMSVFCKCCRKTKDNEEFGLKTDGNQYKTCMKCRNKKIKKPDDEIIKCCDAEAIRDTFKQLNCEIVYASELKYMMDFSSGLTTFFSGMFKTTNIVIVETTTLSNLCSLMNLFLHLSFDFVDIRTYGVNLAIYKDSKDTVMRSVNGCVKNILDGFMKCLKLLNKKMCDICNNKKKCFRQCAKCNNKMCFECLKNHNKEYINSCPYCRYDMLEHSKMNKMMEELFGDGIEM